jgi:hypothetical protein
MDIGEVDYLHGFSISRNPAVGANGIGIRADWSPMDPRRILEEAAQRRTPCELQPRGAGWSRGTLVRVERGGLVLSVSGVRFVGGEDVRVWLGVDGKNYTFEASVIRAGAPIPDRSQNGILLGFINGWAEAQPIAPSADGRLVELIPHNGPSISLLEPPAQVVELAVDGLSFTVPDSFKLIFVESGSVTVRLGIRGKEAMDVVARVGEVVTGEGYRLYGLRFEQVEDPVAHQEIVAALGV